MLKVCKLFLVLLLLLMLSKHSAFAIDHFEQQKEALEAIADFANKICGEYNSQGASTSIDLSGEINAQVKGLLKKLADLGISGTAAYNDKSYQGVLQKDLLELLKNQMTCKRDVAMQFKALVPMEPKKSPTQSSPSVTDPGQKSTLTGQWNSFFGPVTFTQHGQSFTGTLYYSAEQLKKIGATANIKGKRAENTLTFIWWVFGDTPENPTGKGVLTLSDDGNKLDGYFTDKNHPGNFAPWQLVRDQQ
jgi:hypothetical protein